MYIELKNIQHLFSDIPSYLTNSDHTHYLTGWKKLDTIPESFFSHLLYTCEYTTEFENIPFKPEVHFICITKEDVDLYELSTQFPDDASILFLQHADSEMIFDKLQEYFNIQYATGLFGHTLLEFLEFDNSLQSATEYSYRIFQNPVFVFDTNYNLISATWEALEKLNYKDSVTVHKCFTDKEFKMINRMNHIHNKVKKSEIPIRAYNDILGYEQLYCAINTEKDLGHIVVSAIQKPLEDIDEEILLIFKKYVDLQMRKDSFIRNTRGFSYEYFLRDLLDGKLTMNQSVLTSTNYIDSEFSKNMYCLVIETARSSTAINPIQTRNIMESRFPNSKSIIYNGQIVVIINIPTNQLMPEEYIISCQKVCYENELYAGLSNCFQNIFELPEYYLQALRAIELGASDRNEAKLYQYKHYYLDHIKNIFLQKESASTFCHPKMQFLLDYDEIHHSQLAYTLYMYLIHERNLVSTAEAMDMHRTSLVYRFKKINQLIDDNFDDYRERLYMILSYEMYK